MLAYIKNALFPSALLHYLVSKIKAKSGCTIRELTQDTSGNHRLESAGLNALEELSRYREWTEKIVIRACVFRNWMFLDILPEVVIAVLHVVEMYLSGC